MKNSLNVFCLLSIALTSLTSFASTSPHVIATYTDLYNDDDLVGECLAFSDGTAMLMFSNIVPYFKPESFNINPTDFKKLNQALAVEALGKLNRKTGKCNESVAPFEILGSRDGKKISYGVYVTGEAQKELSSNTPYCWIREHRDHVELSEHSKTAKIMKRVCGFVGQ